MARRVCWSVLIWCGLTLARPSVAAAPEIAVTLLGTGTPKASMDRFGPSILVQAGTQTLVFDAGRGALQRLTQLDVTFGQLDALFLTHLHSDHVVGIPDLWLTGWTLSRRDRPLAVFGPSGTADMMEHLRQAFQFDLRIRVADEGMPPAGAEIRVGEVKQGVVYDSGGVKVTAFEIDHGPVSPAFGYRIDYAGRAVILSGDTRFSPNLITFAAHHSRPQDAGKVFQSVQPKLAVYSHVGLNDVTTTQLVARTRTAYSGPLVVGEDLMRFTVGSTVTVYRP